MVLAAACSLSMGPAVTLVDGLDGLAGGIAALALIALSVAALPICSGKLFSFLSYFRVYQFKFYFFIA
jgi:UDP-N-acetylmuramyl pentapeptide phosphotransferase/UDP-N-acetylglucosamine-1-phosphate transferase